MDDFNGALIAICLVILIFFIGRAFGQKSLTDECKSFGAFTSFAVKYECKKAD